MGVTTNQTNNQTPNNPAASPQSSGGPHQVTRIPLLGVNREEESLTSPYDRRSEVYRHLAYEIVKEHPPPIKQPLWTVPNALTFLRLVLVPVVMAVWYTGSPNSPLLAATLFVIASLTDWLDGWIARQFEIATTFGAFLDPVADKVMVTTVLVLLSTEPPAPITQAQMAVPVILICCREVTMSALREWAASASSSAHKAVKVNTLGKYKTALQMTAMSMLLFCRDQTGWLEGQLLGLPAALQVSVVQVSYGAWWLLWGAAVLALWSLSIYFANIWAHFVAPEAKKMQ